MIDKIKQNKRGRSKHTPVEKYDPEDVFNVLKTKISQEEEPIQGEMELPEVEYKIDKCNVLSLFCGVGGLDLGFELASFDSISDGRPTPTSALSSLEKINYSKYEYEEFRKKGYVFHMYSNDIFREALDTYKRNIAHTDTFITSQDIRRINQFPKADVVLGGFPCPGFSEGGPRLIDDPRNFLYRHYIRCLRDSQPKFFIAENVSGMKTLANGLVFQQIKRDFEDAGYIVYDHEVNAADYGVPQLRHRVFLIGVRIDISDFKYRLPPITHSPDSYISLEQAIGDLQTDPGDYYKGSFSPIFMSRNRKKSWHEPSFTIQASGRQAPIHPSGAPMRKIDKDVWVFDIDPTHERRLSVKEIARIQTFPDWYDFYPSNKSMINSDIDKIYKQIGNAVPPLLARILLKPITDYLLL